MLYLSAAVVDGLARKKGSHPSQYGSDLGLGTSGFIFFPRRVSLGGQYTGEANVFSKIQY